MTTKYNIYEKVWIMYENKAIEAYVMRIEIVGNAQKTTHIVEYCLINACVDTRFKSFNELDGYFIRYSEEAVYKNKADLLASL